MKQTSLPNYGELTQALSKTSLKLHPSQAHGLICGILCGSTNSHAAWEDLVTGGQKTEKTHELLQALYAVSAKQLQEFLFDFELVLPTDDANALSIRAEALTLWCQGMLTGLKVVQVPIVDRQPGEVTEAINDLIEIAKMDYEEVVSSEEDEVAYTELVEYVRMAVILIYQDLHAIEIRTTNKTKNKLH